MGERKEYFGLFGWGGKLERFWLGLGIFSLGLPKSYLPNLG